MVAACHVLVLLQNVEELGSRYLRSQLIRIWACLSQGDHNGRRLVGCGANLKNTTIPAFPFLFPLEGLTETYTSPSLPSGHHKGAPHCFVIAPMTMLPKGKTRELVPHLHHTGKSRT